MRQTRSAVAALIFALILIACVPAPGLISTWSDKEHPAQPYTDLVIFGIAASETVRSAYEDSFVAALEKHGIRARAGHTLIPAGGPADAKTLRKAVDLAAPGGVIVTHMRGADSNAPATPTRTHVTPALDADLYPYYQRVYNQVTEPGYYATFRKLQLDSSLYDGKRATLVWSGRSEAMDPTSEQVTIGDVIESMTTALASAGYLPK